jgi:hypothetical protein
VVERAAERGPQDGNQAHGSRPAMWLITKMAGRPVSDGIGMVLEVERTGRDEEKEQVMPQEKKANGDKDEARLVGLTSYVLGVAESMLLLPFACSPPARLPSRAG